MEEGTHQSLLELSGFYFNLVQKQEEAQKLHQADGNDSQSPGHQLSQETDSEEISNGAHVEKISKEEKEKTASQNIIDEEKFEIEE